MAEYTLRHSNKDNFPIMSDIRKNPANSGNNSKKGGKGRNLLGGNKTVKWLWGCFLGLGFFIALILLLIYNGAIGYMPPIEELEDPHDKLASVVYASDGRTELGRYFAGAGNRVYTEYESVSPNVIDALIATEDVRFEEHSGIDFMALGRTGVKTLLLRDKSSGGGSTITQQLAKQLYSQPSQNMFKRAMQKPIEWMIAIKLERFYTKDEILAMYLNRFDFLNNAVGIKTAANVYFGKEPSQLTVPEAAMLVGMLKNPSYYNPLRHPERTRDRRNVVIDQMVKAGRLDKAQAEVYKAAPLGLEYHRVDHREGGELHARIEWFMSAKKWILAACALFLFFYFFITRRLYENLSTIFISAIDIAGLYITYLLVQKSVKIKNPAADRVCGVLQAGGCDSILEMKASKFFGIFGWSEVGFAYFSVSLITLLLFPGMIKWLALYNVCCLPFTVWSIWYQRFKAHKWCTLCVCVQCSLWLQFFCYAFGGWLTGLWPLKIELFVLGAAYLGVMLGLNALMPLIEKNNESK